MRFLLRKCIAAFLLATVMTAHGLLTRTVRHRGPSPSRRRTAPSARRRLLQAAVSSSDSCDVAVFGGGFGGLYAALSISREAAANNKKGGRRNKRLDVVLVEPTESFVFLPLLYDLTAGTATEAEVCPFYADLLRGTGVRRVGASLESIAADGRRAKLRPANGPSPDALSFRAGVVAVGASPGSVLSRVPGAGEFAQPFYTAADAKRTRRLLNRLEEAAAAAAADAGGDDSAPRIAIVGGGFGGVELAASIKRRLPWAAVTLMSRGGPPMAGTRAEPLVNAALRKLGVIVEASCSVTAIEESREAGKLHVRRERIIGGETVIVEAGDERPWDAVLWTAGSGPAFPVPTGCEGLEITASGRLATDPTLRCLWKDGIGNNDGEVTGPPRLWALGDCAEIINAKPPLVPKTAQAAMQQADVVAHNLLACLDENRAVAAKTFEFQDLGSMLTLGGPNGAVLAPKEGSVLAPILAPLLDTANSALSVADQVVSRAGRCSPVPASLSPESLGLSLGSHGLMGADDGAAPGTLAGTLTGAARRAVYAVRMPTNQQRAVSFVSAAICTAAALAREASEKSKE